MSTSARARALILVLCGLPASGKSTLARRILSVARSNAVTAVHLCLDEILFSNHPGQESHQAADPTDADSETGLGKEPSEQQEADAAGFDATAWQASRQRLLQQALEQLQLATQQQEPDGNSPAQQHPLLLVVDDVNHLRSMRYEFVQLARSCEAAFLQLHVDCSLDICLERNRNRTGSDHVPDAVISRLAAAFERPAPEKYQWEAEGRTLTLDSSNITPIETNELWQMVLKHWGAAMPPPPTEEELMQRRLAGTAANAASVVHSFDLETRSMLADALATVAKDARATAAQSLNVQRKQLLHQLRLQLQVQQATAGATAAATDSSVGAHDRAEICTQRLLEQFRSICAGFQWQQQP